MKFFYENITLDVPESVYFPREDSVLLGNFIKSMNKRKCLEIGCGSGFLSVLMAKKGADVTSIDISSEAVETTKKNAIKNGVKINVFVSDLFQNIRDKFDVIIFNPPYLPDNSNDKTYSGGITGRDVIERFVKECRNHINPQGIIVIIISSLTGEKDVLYLLKNSGFDAKIVSREKILWEEIMVIKAKPKVL